MNIDNHIKEIYEKSSRKKNIEGSMITLNNKLVFQMTEEI